MADAATARKPAPKPAAAPTDDLSVSAVRHVANCPPPKAGVCVIRKPVDVGYRVLTQGVELEDRGDHWVADFGKSPNAKGASTQLRVVGRDGDLHEIEVSFRKASVPKANGKPK